jgi:hypothetical protein
MVAVTTDIVINLPREKVAEFATNPDTVYLWYAPIRSVEWQSPPPLQVGSKLAVTIEWFGLLLQNSFQVVEYIPGQKLIVRSVNEIFQLEITLGWHAIDGRTTRMTIRSRGLPVGFSKVLTPLIAWVVKRINHRDLKFLKRLLEKRRATLQAT